MKKLILDENTRNVFGDLKNNIERLKRIRSLNTKDLDEEFSIKSKILSLGNKIIFFNSHFQGRI